MPWPDLLAVATIAIVTSAVVGGLGVLALVLLRRASLVVQVCVLVLAAMISVVASMVGVANEMYLSEHDLTVAVAVAAISGVVSLALVAGLGWVVARNSRALSDAARRIGAGERIESAGRSTNSELNALADELVATSARLAESRERERRIEASRRELVAWISHDLRTPLAGIRAMAEALEDGIAPDPARYHRQMRIQVDQLSSMVDDLFELSRIDSDALHLSLKEVSLSDIVSDTVADLRPASRGRDIRVDAPLAQDLVVMADPRELSRAVGNLLMNAIQHTPEGSPITVAVDLVDDRAMVSVIDAGGGIDDADLDRVFEPAWRGSKARTPSLESAASSGAGLGLAIVKGIMSAHRGEVAVRNVPGGCRFDLLLPSDASVKA
ncbi:signal transduction histidine kinase [Agromyces flavus]|uniref:Sensor-like histidine kinase SenX3 n=1 Tax=Agromyces flavus TaxID=589382 RepID=A0A1H1MZI3_9MICO|nr:HAMP domain-containing sensor histidine kinase [Agromyces flavus]MCP2369179.1 signal transduction histidine kinase [Agromyces flavus]GGI48660.1 two-component sensor histidine kinase [Agromyces flavus]SDR92102.1 Signal transduction histidine kinase [Agromyces flavus]